MGKHYRIALVGSASFVRGDALAETYVNLASLGHGVELVDPDLVPGIVDADGNLDDAVAARFLDVFKPDYVATRGESAEEILGALEGSGRGQEAPVRHVVVFGYVGPGNFGDELIFSIIAKAVRSRYEGSFVTVIGHDPAATFARHGVVSVTPLMKARINASLNGASALVFMAGIMFDQPFEDWTAGPVDLYLNPHSEIAGQTACALMAYQNDVPSVFLGIGAGPLDNPDARRLVKLASLTRPRYVTRDSGTAEVLRRCGVGDDLIAVKSDLAFSLDKPPVSPRCEKWLRENGLREGEFLSAAFRDHSKAGDSLVESMAALFDRAFEAYGLRTAFFDFAPEDAGIHHRIAAAMEHGDACAFFGPTDDEGLTLEALSLARACVAMRLHCSIVSNAFGIPGIGVNYNDKVEALYGLTGMRDLLLSCDCSADEAVAALERLMSSEGALRNIVSARAESLRSLSHEALDALFSAIEAAPAEPRKQMLYARDVSADSLALREAEERARALDERVDQLERRIDGMERSATWRAGRALTAPLRLLKGAVKRL